MLCLFNSRRLRFVVTAAAKIILRQKILHRPGIGAERPANRHYEEDITKGGNKKATITVAFYFED